MVQLTFTNGTPNTSLETGDLVYFIDSTGTNDGYLLIGEVSAIQIDNDPDQVSGQVEVTVSTFTIFVSNQPSNFGEYQPSLVANSFIFFAKNNAVELSSIAGYYNKVKFDNNSKDKAELFSVACGVERSSK